MMVPKGSRAKFTGETLLHTRLRSWDPKERARRHRQPDGQDSERAIQEEQRVLLVSLAEDRCEARQSFVGPLDVFPHGLAMNIGV